MRLALPLAIFVLALALLSGCGSSEADDTSAPAPNPSGANAPAGASAHECGGEAGSASALRATGISCQEAKALAAAWARNEGCAPADGASRSSCKLEDDYVCLTATTDRGLAVSCARPGRSFAFTVKGS